MNNTILLRQLKLAGIVSLICTFSFKVCAQSDEQGAQARGQVITIETATLRGNQELPTVLYLVPWQPPQIQRLVASQTAELLSQPVEAINRNSFLRLINYHQAFSLKKSMAADSKSGSGKTH